MSKLVDFFKASDLPEIEPGNTLPPPLGAPDVSHLKTFEALASDLRQVMHDERALRLDRDEFEAQVIEQRRTFDQMEIDLQYRKGTVEDQINQHIESIYPDARLVHMPKGEPELEDVRIPQQEEADNDDHTRPRDDRHGQRDSERPRAGDARRGRIDEG